MNNVFKCRFMDLKTLTFSSGVASMDFDDVTLGGPVRGDFLQYRITKFRFCIIRASSTGLKIKGAVYPTAAVEASPTYAQLQGPYVIAYHSSNERPSEWLNTPHQYMRGLFTWYNANAGGVDIETELQGQVLFRESTAASTATFDIWYEVEFEFRGLANETVASLPGFRRPPAGARQPLRGVFGGMRPQAPQDLQLETRRETPKERGSESGSGSRRGRR